MGLSRRWRLLAGIAIALAFVVNGAAPVSAGGSHGIVLYNGSCTSTAAHETNQGAAAYMQENNGGCQTVGVRVQGSTQFGEYRWSSWNYHSSSAYAVVNGGSTYGYPNNWTVTVSDHYRYPFTGPVPTIYRLN